VTKSSNPSFQKPTWGKKAVKKKEQRNNEFRNVLKGEAIALKTWVDKVVIENQCRQFENRKARKLQPGLYGRGGKKKRGSEGTGTVWHGTFGIKEKNTESQPRTVRPKELGRKRSRLQPVAIWKTKKTSCQCAVLQKGGGTHF